LHPANFRRFVRLGVRTQAYALLTARTRHPVKVAVQGIEIDG